MNQNRNKTENKYNRYLSYGFDDSDSDAGFSHLREFLDSRLPKRNNLTEARNRQTMTSVSENGTVNCDYCGKSLSGTPYEKMKSGRIICHDCASKAISSEQEFVKAAKKAAETMKTFIGDELIENVKWIMSEEYPENAIQSLSISVSGFVTKPTSAIVKTDSQWQIWVLSGTSNLTIQAIVAAALALIWQEERWDLSRLSSICSRYSDKDAESLIHGLRQGMALWTACECLILNGNKEFSDELFQSYVDSETAEGSALLLYESTYLFRNHFQNLNRTPFIEAVPVSLKVLMDMMIEHCVVSRS